MLSEAIVGPPQQSLPVGTQKGLRADNTGGTVIQASHAKYYEAVYRGNVYCGGNIAVVTFGTAFTASAVTLTLWNPNGSGKNLVVLKCSLSIVTATTSGSILYVGTTPGAVPTGLTALTPVNCLLGSGNTPVGKLYSGATISAIPNPFRPIAGAIATGAVNSPSSVIDPVDGEFIVSPGCTLSIQGLTIAGTGMIGMSWEEVPV